MDCSGDLPDRRARDLMHQKSMKEQRQWYTVETLVLDLNGIEPVPAYFVRPLESTGRIPVILYDHAHGGDYVLGKDELIAERGGLQQMPYAEAFARAGYASA